MCRVGSFWGPTCLWLMQRLPPRWLTCWLQTRATPAASFPSCTSSTATPRMCSRYLRCIFCSIPRCARSRWHPCLPVGPESWRCVCSESLETQKTLRVWQSPASLELLCFMYLYATCVHVFAVQFHVPAITGFVFSFMVVLRPRCCV